MGEGGEGQKQHDLVFTEVSQAEKSVPDECQSFDLHLKT